MILFACGVRIWKFILGISVLLFSIPLLLNFLKPYQKDRLISFINPEDDALGRGYQLIQSKIALGSGGFSGKGFLEGTQSYLQYLPEKQTDFIFTLIGEEFGFIGVCLLLTVFIFILLRCLYLALNARDRFCRLTIGGLSLIFLSTVLINLSMVVGIIPVVGMPLSFYKQRWLIFVIILYCLWNNYFYGITQKINDKNEKFITYHTLHLDSDGDNTLTATESRFLNELDEKYVVRNEQEIHFSKPKFSFKKKSFPTTNRSLKSVKKIENHEAENYIEHKFSIGDRIEHLKFWQKDQFQISKDLVQALKYV